MGIIRNGITTNNTELTEFKRNTATVQQQMQSQISDLRDKLTDAYTEIANMKKTKSQFEQEASLFHVSMASKLSAKGDSEAFEADCRQVHAECQSLAEQLQTSRLFEAILELRELFRGSNPSAGAG